MDDICRKKIQMDFVQFVKRNQERETISGLLVFFGFLCLGFVLANILHVGMLLVSLMAKSERPLNLEDITDSLSNLTKSKSDWWMLITMQGLSAIAMFVFTSMAYWFWIEKKKWSDFSSRAIPVIAVFLSVFMIQLTSIPLTSYIGSINENIKMPDSLSGLETMFKAMEKSAAELTEFIAKSDSTIELLMSILVIGVIAGVGEELVFRGIIQRKLIRGLNNHHLAIWISAIVFSAIHFQFYGFLPRVVLGALFGYLYVWTGNIWIPIAAHTFNNTVAVVIYHLIHKGKISPDLEKMDTIPFAWVAFSSVVCLVLMFTFYNQQSNRENKQKIT
jgi:membrane protease YdiL (CAAX protease family)